MAWVVLRIAPDPARLRDLRMVVRSLARREGLDERLVDDLRLAITEATARAIGAHQAADIDDPVRIELEIGEQVEVRVTDRHPQPLNGPEASSADLEDVDVPDRLAIISRIAEEYDLRIGMDETVVTMRWRVRPPESHVPTTR